jgi:DNA invertase Pin-like site-specific DNA recombinase
MRFVSYLRVSTERQGQSGLGLEAQRAAIAVYTTGRGDLVSEFVEVESGKRADRPELEKALAEAKRMGAVLVIAKLDRLARNVAFIATLIERKIEIAACDMPEANRVFLHIMAAMAEHEAQAISDRTKAALAAAKARGQALGWSIPGRQDEQRQAARKGAARNAEKADRHAGTVRPLIEALQTQGMSLRGIAAELNARNVKTARGGDWHAATVRNALQRAE